MPGRSQVAPTFRSAFRSPSDEFDRNLGIRPVVFDILAPDMETSILPEGVKMVLHVNPSSMALSFSKLIERIQTKGGFVEQHWGEGARSISFNMATGGFKRLYSGLSNVTGGGIDTGGTRRETIAYDKYLDLLALFHNNGAVFDQTGEIAFQGILKIVYDGGIYLGWFASFNVQENAEKPYMFDLTAEFVVAHEVLRLRSMPWQPEPLRVGSVVGGGAGVEVINQTPAGQVINVQRGVDPFTTRFTSPVSLQVPGEADL